MSANPNPMPVEIPNGSKSSGVSATLMPQLYAHLPISFSDSLFVGSGLKTTLSLYQDTPRVLMPRLYTYTPDCQSSSSQAERKKSLIANSKSQQYCLQDAARADRKIACIERILLKFTSISGKKV